MVPHPEEATAVPCQRPSITIDTVRDLVAREVFDGDDPVDLTGVELEWLLSRPDDRDVRPGRRELADIVAEVGQPPAGSRVTLEPGGQVELSSPPLPGSEAACAAAATDLLHLDTACRSLGFELVALGADPLREPERIVTEPRYDAMQDYFDDRNGAGRTMMCNTASIQVNVGLGTSATRRSRWELVNLLGPVLVAAFANSPFALGAPSGWLSTRYRAWQSLDPSRSSPVPLDDDPVEAFTRYVLDARVMLIRAADDDYRVLATPVTFGAWIADGHELGWPDAGDLAYHLTTLFPPVRPRGWFELRMIDALPTPFWQIAVTVVDALVGDEAAGDAAAAACRPVADLWADAAQLGLGHPELQQAATRTMEVALEVVAAADLTVADAAADFADRYTSRGRSPADDRLDAWRRDGSLFPPPLSPLLPHEAPAPPPHAGRR